jgi:hypothetical protein
MKDIEADIKNLKINWQTDLSLIDFSVLLSEIKIPTRQFQQIKIEWFPANEVCANVKCELFKNVDLHRIVNLIDLIDNGEKIIPIIANREIEVVNGVTNKISNRPINESIFDGRHRQILSQLSNQTEIPVVVVQYVSRMVFSPELWQINFNDDVIDFKNLQNEQEYQLNMANINVGELNLNGDLEFRFHPQIVN